MRYIALDQLYVPNEWAGYTQELVEELRGKTAEERSELLDKPSYKVWTKLRILLEKLSYGKCFYTEMRIIGALPDIDHFRPKNRVHSADLNNKEKHSGYWWLAFNEKNFRYCCQTANRLAQDSLAEQTLGKGTRFPIAANGKRAFIPEDLSDDEKHLLLDPAKREDVRLLCFADEGKAMHHPASSAAERLRVEISIQCYNLNEPNLAYRRGHLCTEAKHMAEEVQELDEKAETTKLLRNELRQLIEKKIKLYDMIQPYAEFSAAVRSVLMPFKHLSPSVREIFDRTPKDQQ
jgi:hypothetical protein